MKNNRIFLGAIVLIALLCCTGTVAAQDTNSTMAQDTGEISDEIAPYSGAIGADSPLHGLKIAMEDLDETFTFNDSRRVEKQADHATIRISELRRELELNRTAPAERALNLYQEKLNLTERSLTKFSSNATGLLRAQEMISRNQMVLANLSLLYPDNNGLVRAYTNSLSLELKFEQKTEMRFARLIEKGNKTIFRAIKLEIRDQNRTRDGENGADGTPDQDRNTIRDKIKEQKNATQVNETITQTEYRNNTPAVNKNAQKDKGSSEDKNKNGRN